MSKNRSLLFKILTLVMALGVFLASVPLTVSAVEITPSAPLKGDGTQASPYEISTKEELYWFAQLVNGKLEGIAANPKASAILTNDITVNKKVLENDELVSGASSLIKWTPIGYSSNYAGFFDGKGYTISGLYCVSGSKEAGVFSRSDEEIKNLNVSDSYFNSNQCAGGICGYISEAIYNCNVSAIVESSSDLVGGIAGKVAWNGIENCSFSGIVKGINYVGGICGETMVKISDCKNYGTVIGEEYVGGIAGFSSHKSYWEETTRNCNVGDVKGRLYVGGLFGMLDYTSTIYNSYNAGSVTATEKYAGGICATAPYNEFTLSPEAFNCYNSGKVYAPIYSGAFSSGYGSNLYGEGNFYLKGSAIDGGGYEQFAYGKGWHAYGGGFTECVTEVTREDLESGKLAYKLQNAQGNGKLVWGQIDYSTGSHPVLTNNEAYRVDKYTNINGTEIYISGGTGDFDNDKVISEADYDMLLKTALGETVEDGGADVTDETAYAKSDVNNDGVIDVLDVALLERKLGK